MDNRPLPRRDRVRLFRGEYAGVWERRLVNNGWPQPLAGEVARFLTSDARLPHWPAALDAGQALLDEHDRITRGRIILP